MVASASVLVAAFLWMTPVQTSDGRLPQEVQVPPDSGGEAAAPRLPGDFSGVWEYNAELSVNAATGRSETARATQERLGIGRGLAATALPSPMDVSSGASAVRAGLYNIYMTRRDTRRDLMEIAPILQLNASPEGLTVTDDLDRQLTFPLDGTKQNYQLGAALFDARTYWQDDQIRMDIEGPDGFRMSETWLLSEDGSKLFLIIRVGEPEKDARPVGVNRVYDRVQ